jgi:hypothetical protein
VLFKASDASNSGMVTLELKKYSEINLKRFLFPENRISKRPLLKNCRKKSPPGLFEQTKLDESTM